MEAEYRYASFIKQMVDLIGPKDLRLIAGRGTGKTADIIADRSIDVIHSMPRALSAFTSDTYVNAKKNIIPTLIEGWREYKGWREGHDYVIDERPPSFFDIPYKPITAFKNTISTRNGHGIVLGSLDQPSGLAGGSFQHLYSDENRFNDPKKLKVILPALRGHVRFSHSPFYRGTTFTTDMPNVTRGDYDWILADEKDMDIEQAKLAYYTGCVVNEINIEIFEAQGRNDQVKLKKLMRNRVRWMERWMRTRKDLTFFYIVSSFANADILQPGYFLDNLKNLGWEDFKTSVLSYKSQLEQGDRFYTNLGKQHFYDDGINYSYVDKFSIKDDFEGSSLMLRLVQHRKPLDVGLDFGTQNSMTVGQESGAYYYVLKNFFTLAEPTVALCNKFLEFFEPHQNKVINLYYDRSGNQYASVKRDWATDFKNHLETDEKGKKTGWEVNLMSRNQSNITQEEEYLFMQQLLEENTKGLPKVRVDKYQCAELKSSLELTKVKIKKNERTGATSIHKDKSSEKLPIHKLPMLSTNFSDSWKYLLYRRQWYKITKRRSTGLPLGMDGN